MIFKVCFKIIFIKFLSQRTWQHLIGFQPFSTARKLSEFLLPYGKHCSNPANTEKTDRQNEIVLEKHRTS